MHSLLLKLIVALMIVSQVQSTLRASFGEACDKGVRCDSRSSLSCSDGICQCIKPNEMTFDNTTRKCVVFSSERCSYTAVEILETAQEKRWTEKLECVENAICNNDGYCGCKSEFFENTDGFCVPKRSFGGNCTSDGECRLDKKLLCIDGKCACNKTEATFDPFHNECAALAGSDCMKYNRCVINAYCPRRQGYSYTANICTCRPQFKQSKHGLCLINYGGSCHPESSPCSEVWACINGKCQCHFQDHQFFNTTLGKCSSYVRGPCLENISFNDKDEDVVSFTCVENAECKADHGVHECRCKDGFIENKRMCNIAHGQPCAGQLCDEAANLICKNGRCSCPDFQIYDNSISKCRGLVGSKCILKENNFCIDGAACDSYRGLATGEGVCRCISASVTGPNRKCNSNGPNGNSAKLEVSESVPDLDAIVDNNVESFETTLVFENSLNITEILSPV
ncbi:unnamed protein product [Orchesella dallaii]|uniref:EGF-like domain-containing protein n=1 Tax=Orchesella dallaii TaxID=48710 RepID=A0ABP1Q9G3_9HEXA